MQNYQHLFRTTYIESLIQELRQKNSYQKYLSDTFEYKQSEVIDKTTVKTDYPELLMPTKENNYDFENAKIIFESYKDMNPLDATDIRMWTYLSHVTYWKYMRIRRPIEKQPDEKKAEYIIRHWFIDTLNSVNIFRQDIALLWWGAYLTYDAGRSNPYELTEETFSMLDYTRHLLPGIQGRNINFAHAILEFVIENKDLFSEKKEPKVRFIMRRANHLAGYKNFTFLNKEEIKSIFLKYKDKISSVMDDIELEED